MAMSVRIDCLTGTGPTVTAVTLVKVNRADDPTNTTSPIPAPSSTGTNFSFIKTLQVEILATGALAMTNILAGKLTAEPTPGSKLWYVALHAAAAYVHATAAPAATTDNNVTPPTLNGDTAVAVPLFSAPPGAYSAGPFSATGRVGNLVEIAYGLDANYGTGGTSVPGGTLRFGWTES